jgi:glucan phosphoethanolaminetransferase (alkaline phosphatase superfamily)
MKLFKKIDKVCNPVLVQSAFVVALCVPNIVLCYTEQLSFWASCANLLLPFGIYMMLLSLNRNIGKTIWALFPIIFLCAFQVVLFFLYGGSIIGVDMFLNVVTTSPTEAGELLANLLSALAAVGVLYLLPLIYAGVNLFKKRLLNSAHQKRYRKGGAICAMLGIVALLLSYLFVNGYALSREVFPVNVIKNMAISVKRINQNRNYPETSKDFRFNATSVHPDDREVYVVVIGETGRANNFGVMGYERPTTPMLSKADGVVAFNHVLSESNTTHKSVPMLLSLVEADNYNTINTQKSIITAFKEAGFATAYVSSQPFNRSYIDYFGNEADYVNFINADRSGKNLMKDDAMLPVLDSLISTTKAAKLALFVHSYGSHFNYSDRYDRKFARFTPDNSNDASVSNRENLINAYDNTIVHTDYLLGSVIQRLQRVPDAITAMMYVTDHGEDIFDDRRERFLHASPTPTYWQLHVPMIFWMSDAYRRAYPATIANVLQHRSSQISSSRSFAPSVMAIAGVVTSKIDVAASVVSASYVEPKRVYVSDRNECLPLDVSGLRNIDFDLMRQHGITY